MPFNLLLLPLLGGFVFVSRWNPSRCYILRTDGYRLLFHSAVAGLGLSFLSSSIVFAFQSLPDRFVGLVKTSHRINETWQGIAPIPYSGRAVLAFLMGCALWFPLNYLVLYKNHQIDNAILGKLDPLEVLLREAMGQAKTIFLKLKNDEIYVGYVISNFNPVFQIEYLKILPIITGYQDVKLMLPKCTVYNGDRYIQIFEEAVRSYDERLAIDRSKARKGRVKVRDQKLLLEDIEICSRLKDFEVAIPVKDIQSAQIFNVDEYVGSKLLTTDTHVVSDPAESTRPTDNLH